MKFCYNCGSPIEEEGAFCVICGAKLSLVNVEESDEGQSASEEPDHRPDEDEDALQRAEEEMIRAEEEARRQAEEEARRQAEEEARRQAKEAARRQAEEAARRRTEQEELRREVKEEAELRRTQEEQNRRSQAADVFYSSKESEEKKKKSNTALWIILLLIIVALAVVLVVVLINANKKNGGSEETDDDGGALVAEYNGNFKIADGNGKVWIEAKHVRKVTIEKEGGSGNPTQKDTQTTATEEDTYRVRVELTGEGKKLLEDVTRENKGKQIYIYVNDIVVSAPVIKEVITGGVVEIAGGISKEEAEQIRDGIIGDAVKRNTEELTTDPAKKDTEAPTDDYVIEGRLPISEPSLGMILDVLPSLPKYNLTDSDTGEVSHPGLTKMKDKDGVLIGAILPALSQKAESILKEIQTGRGQGDHFMYDVQDVITMSEIFANESVSEEYLDQCMVVVNRENDCGLYGMVDGMVDAYDATVNGPYIKVERIEAPDAEIMIYYIYGENSGDSGDYWEAHFTVDGGKPWFDYTKYLGNSGSGSEESGKNTEKNTTEKGTTEKTTTEKTEADAVQTLQKDEKDLGGILSFIMQNENPFWSNRQKQSGYTDSDAVDSVMSAMNWAKLSTQSTEIDGKTYYMCPVDTVCRIINLLAKNDITADELSALIKEQDDTTIEMYRKWNGDGGMEWFSRTKVEDGMVLSPMEVGEPLTSEITGIAAEGDGAVVTFLLYGAGEGEDYWLAHFKSDGKDGVYLDSIEPR
ncbi:MAG: hypothetical protein IKN79_07870 [Eubacterium sp.]|nr:hypothetical protein [Eubacterium sp.]